MNFSHFDLIMVVLILNFAPIVVDNSLLLQNILSLGYDIVKNKVYFS